MAETKRKILAASFETPDGGSRGAGAIGGAFPEKLGNTLCFRSGPTARSSSPSRGTGEPGAARCSAG